MNNFWQKLDKPILALAPMADVTDAAYRFIIAKYGKDAPCQFVMFTEFTSADGLVLAPEEGRKKLLKNLEYSEIERPIVAQFFTSRPENMEKIARLAVKLGFDGVDINMGCPDRSVEKQGAGAALIENPQLARELIIAAKKQNKIPVSVKTRLGYNKDELEIWLPELLAEKPAAITIHARTRKDMSKVPARWERIARAVEIRNNSPLAPLLQQERGKTLILGNGDILNTEDAINKCNETGADGAMFGRAIFGNPWLMSNHKPTTEERLRVLVEHSKLFEQKFTGPNDAVGVNFKSFAVMKKHYKAYLKDVPNAHELKMNLMEAKNASEVEKIVGGLSLF